MKKYKSKEFRNYYNIGTLLLFQWVKFIGWCEGKLRKLKEIKFKKSKPF